MLLVDIENIHFKVHISVVLKWSVVFFV